MSDTTTVAIPPALRDLLTVRAKESQTSQDALADEALRDQLAIAREEQARGERLAERYLTDPRITGAGQSAPTVHISREANTGAQALAVVMGEEVGRNVPKGRAIQALLWARLAPLPPSSERISLPAPPTLDTVTVSVPAELNTALLDLALRRNISREALIDALLEQGFADLDTNLDARLAELTAHKRYKAADGHGKTTIRVRREHDARARAIAEMFEGKKSYALQALLWRGLEQTDDEPPAALPDRPVLIGGELYARVARLALVLREERGKVVPIKELVEEALRRAVEREERRLQQGPKRKGTG